MNKLMTVKSLHPPFYKMASSKPTYTIVLKTQKQLTCYLDSYEHLGEVFTYCFQSELTWEPFYMYPIETVKSTYICSGLHLGS